MAHFTFLLTLLSSFQTIQSNVWYGSKFECHGRNKCYDDQIHCDDYKHCKIECYGPNACQYTIIHCPTGANCEVECKNGLDACKDVIFLAERSSQLSIACDRSQDEACDETIIYCPNNGQSGPPSCKISGLSQINVKTKIEIFAIEGLNDVEITGTYIKKAFLYCGLQYKSACTLPDTFPFTQCISTDKTCENYVLPTSKPTKSPTVDPTAFPTDYPSNLPTYSPTPIPTKQTIATDTPTVDPTAFPTDYPSDFPTYSPTLKPTNRPTASESDRTTRKPTVWAMPTNRPTRREADLEYTTKEPTSNPTVKKPVNPNAPTPRPTRYTRFGSLLTTTNDGGGVFGVGDDGDEIDPNGVERNDSKLDESSSKETNLNALYYVISALLISICYISVSLFCWVHYNHKYTSRVIELKQKRHSETRLQSPAVMPPGVVWQANHLHIPEPGAANYNSNYSNHHLQQFTHNSNHLETRKPSASMASNITAPTTVSRKFSIGNNNNIIEEEQHTNAPTSVHSKSSTQSIHSSQSHYIENNSDFKEVAYETNHNYGHGHENNQTKASQLTMDSVEFAKNYIHDDSCIVQYGERLKDGPKETHSLKVSNVSDYNVVYRYNSVIGDTSEKNEELKEVDIETWNDKECEQDEEDEEPVQPLMAGKYNNILAMSPPVNQSISFSGSPSQMFVTGHTNSVLYRRAPQYGQ